MDLLTLELCLHWPETSEAAHSGFPLSHVHAACRAPQCRTILDIQGCMSSSLSVMCILVFHDALSKTFRTLSPAPGRLVIDKLDKPAPKK